MISHTLVEAIWYGRHPLVWLLIPVSWIYRFMVACRRFCYQTGVMAVKQIGVPVIVVGNISVGGTGKTPLVLWLADYLKQKGFRPGIISRGYGGRSFRQPQQVRADSNPALVGDEPVLIARNTNCPVAVAIERCAAAEALIAHCACDFVLCDDGLQHYALGRDLEIALIDGWRRFGNRQCLPAGPLREPIRRLESVDLVVSKHMAFRHEFKMDYIYADLISIQDPTRRQPVSVLAGESVHVIAGIGNPDRFFAHLRHQQLNIIMHQFPDHHLYRADEIKFNDGLPVVMTEKDAIKCEGLAEKNHWYLPIRADLPESFVYRLDTLMQDMMDG